MVHDREKNSRHSNRGPTRHFLAGKAFPPLQPRAARLSLPLLAGDTPATPPFKSYRDIFWRDQGNPQRDSAGVSYLELIAGSLRETVSNPAEVTSRLWVAVRQRSRQAFSLSLTLPGALLPPLGVQPLPHPF
jgi:hypothetical protein